LAIHHDSGDLVVVAVASRSLERSRKFIEEMQAKKAIRHPSIPLGSYEELLALKNVDGVYIPLPTGLRKPGCWRPAAGKHVLCEKAVWHPFRRRRGNDRRLPPAGRAVHGGVMFMHNPGSRAFAKLLGLTARASATSNGSCPISVFI